MPEWVAAALLEKCVVAARKHSFDVALDHGFEGVFVPPFRVLRHHGIDPIKGKGDLKRIRPFGP
jgi:hypothetical protein